MRILVLIIMIIAFLVGAGSASIIKYNLDGRTKNVDYEQLAEYQKKIDEFNKEGIDIEKIEDPTIKEAIEVLEKVPSKARINLTVYVGIALALVSLYMVIVAFAKKEIVKKVCIVVIALGVLFWILTPSIEASLFSAADPKNISLTAFIFLLIASTCAFLSYNMYLKKINN